MGPLRTGQLEAILNKLLAEEEEAISPASHVVELPGYELGELLGEGGSAVVFKARQVSTGRAVAVKFFRRSTNSANAGDDQNRSSGGERFRREIAALARLDHPGFPDIIDCGEQRGVRYIVQEFVDGRGLDHYVRDHGLGAADVIRLMTIVARTVGVAHEAGFVHRDLKPANILIRASDGAPVIIDFGIVTGAAPDLVRDVTVTGGVLGTPVFMAPEQMRGEPATPASDVYSLALITIQLINRGESDNSSDGMTSPTPRSSRFADRRARRQLRLTDGRTSPVAIGRELVRATAADPADRHTSASEFAAALERAAERRPRWSPQRAGAIALGMLILGAAALMFGRSSRPYAGQPTAWPTLTPIGGRADDRFGVGLDADVEWVFVGAPNHDSAGEDAGAVFVFQHYRNAGTWRQPQKLLPDAVTTDYSSTPAFGDSVNVSGDWALITAGGTDANGKEDSGAAYFFRYDGVAWSRAQRFTPEDSQHWDYLGTQALISDEYAFIASCLSDDRGPESGKVYVLRLDREEQEWRQIQILHGSDTQAHDWFGTGMALQGERLVVGASRNNRDDVPSGAAYVFELDSETGRWRETARLLADDAADRGSVHWFGEHVAIDGDTIVVSGGRVEDRQSPEPACAYVYRLSGAGWTEEAKVEVPPPDGPSAVAGTSPVVIRENTIWLSACGRPETGAPSGLYRFDRIDATWEFTATLTPEGIRAEEFFGHTLSLAGDLLLVSAPELGTDEPGRVYLFDAGADDADDGSSVQDGDTLGAAGIDQFVPARLLAPDGAAADRFGASIAVAGDLAVIGAQRGQLLTPPPPPPHRDRRARRRRRVA